MPDIDDLRRAMRSETTGLVMGVSIDRITRRARGLRARRTGVMTAAVAVGVVTLAVPGYALLDRTQPRFGDPPMSSPSSCGPRPSASQRMPQTIGPLVETGTSIEAADRRRFDVLLGLIGQPDRPMFSIVFRDQRTGQLDPWDMSQVVRGPDGDFAGHGPAWHFYSSQMPLDAGRVLDAGIYSRAAQRIVVASADGGADARLARNAETGWTFFWVEREARPLPADANTGPEEYTGPERLTITAYDAGGRRQHTVTGGFNVGGRTQNPRDNGPDPLPTQTPGLPCA
ncbi:MAG TPA: hypothetical protein VF062_17765 [Candidatus Limnocylindrales bacterium]